MNNILVKQLALDYCCTESDVTDNKTHFTLYRPLEGRRRFSGDDECYLKITVVNGKVLFCGEEEVIGKCREMYEGTGGEWFFEADNICKLNELLGRSGHKIKLVHPFFISEDPTPVTTWHHKGTSVNDAEYDIVRYEKDEIGQFRGDSRFDEAFAFVETAPDVLGFAAVSGGKILGMSGASCDSPTMWQIGINVEPEARGKGIGTTLVTILKNEILKEGKLPFYGTSMSHIASQRLAIGAGFVPAWCEPVGSKST